MEPNFVFALPLPPPLANTLQNSDVDEVRVWLEKFKAVKVLAEQQRKQLEKKVKGILKTSGMTMPTPVCTLLRAKVAPRRTRRGA